MESSENPINCYEAIDRLTNGLGDEGLYTFISSIWDIEKKAKKLLAELYPEWYEKKALEIIEKQESLHRKYEQGSMESFLEIRRNIAKRSNQEVDEEELLEEWQRADRSYYENLKNNTSNYMENEDIEELKGETYLTIFPRLKEMDGHINLFLFEALNEVPWGDRNKDHLTYGLARLLWAGHYYGRYGMEGKAKNVWERVYLAAEQVAGYGDRVEPIYLGLLYETMGVCNLLLERDGAHDHFERSYDLLSLEHMRMVLTDIAWEAAREEMGFEYKMEIIETPIGEVLLPQDVFDQLSPTQERRKLIALFDSLPGETIRLLYESADQEKGKMDVSRVTIVAPEITEELLQRIANHLSEAAKHPGIERIHLSPSYDELVHANEGMLLHKLGFPELWLACRDLEPFKNIDCDHMSLKRSEFYLQHSQGL